MRRSLPLLVASSLAVLAAGPSATRAEEMQVVTLAGDDLVVTRSTLVRPGTYRVVDGDRDGVIHVRGSHLTLDLAGVMLDGTRPGADASAFEGVGISIEGGTDVRIHGGACRGYRVGLRAERTHDLRVDGFDGSGNRRDRLKSTPEAEDASDWLWPHENDGGEWEARYGAGLSLVSCGHPTVWGCRARHGQNGLLLDGCDRADVRRCDFSFDSGWGVALWRSSDGRFEENRCDFCVRGYSHGRYARGQDSAGFLVFEQSSGNVFRRNSATHSGDGFFLYAGNETLRRTGAGGCNRNAVVGNDFSHAVANGIEATFSEENVFRDNVLADCDHGLWAGYSSRSAIEKNWIVRCGAGVSIEHGTDNRIVDNDLTGCRLGVHLWWDDDADLLASAFGRKHPGAPSSSNAIEGNRFVGGETSIRLEGDARARVSANEFEGASTGVHLSGPALRPLLRDNRFRLARGGVAARCDDGGGAWLVGLNDWGEAPPVFVGDVRRREPAPGSERPPDGGADVPRTPRRRAYVLGAFSSRDRDAIFCGEWGPFEPAAARIVRPWAASAAATTVYLRGDAVPFTAEALGAGTAVEPASGVAPTTLHVRPAGASGRAFVPWAVRVRMGAADETIGGSSWALPWKVRFFEWTKDPRDDADAFAALVAGPPTDEVTLPALEGAWPGRPTPKVRADRFATVAEAKGTFDAGRYVVRVTSDDGVRVLVDGGLVYEDWTWHAPRDAAVSILLSAGEHALRVEHFELYGYATLRCALEPAASVDEPR